MARILYFGVARDIAGIDGEEIHIADNTSIESLWTMLIERHSGLARVRSVSRLAVDMEYATDRSTVDDAAEIAIIPPVAGG